MTVEQQFPVPPLPPGSLRLVMPCPVCKGCGEVQDALLDTPPVFNLRPCSWCGGSGGIPLRMNGMYDK